MAVDPGNSFISGKFGYVVTFDPDTSVAVTYSFAEWSAPLRAEFIKRNSFLSQGFQTGVSGFKSTQIRIKGPYPSGAPPLRAGEYYDFYLGIDTNGPVEFFVPAHISELTPTNSAEGAPDLEIVADSVGEFQFATN